MKLVLLHDDADEKDALMIWRNLEHRLVKSPRADMFAEDLMHQLRSELMVELGRQKDPGTEVILNLYRQAIDTLPEAARRRFDKAIKGLQEETDSLTETED